jgi:peptide/nickel transport system substrate-binding protein
MSSSRFSRRDFLKQAALAAIGGTLVACQPKTIVVEKEVEKVVKETVVVKEEVEKVVKETVVVKEEVEKVVKETVVVEKEVEVTPTPDYVGGLPGPREDCLIYGRGQIQHYDSFNPHVSGAAAWGEGIWAAMIEHGWYVNLATGEITPWLATGYEYNDDFTSFTLHLREGVKWNDGEPFTSADVVFTDQMIMEHEEMGGNVDLNKQIAEITAVDDFTVRWDFNMPVPRFNLRFMCFVGAFIWEPKHIWGEVDFPVIFKNNPPVYTGPYKMVPTQREDGMLVFERYDEYWGYQTGFTDLPAPRFFVVRTEPPADAEYEVALQNEVDIPSGLNYSVLEQLVQENPNFELSIYLDPCPRGIFFNTELVKWPEVRRAIQYCCDRDTVGELIWQPPSHGTKFPWAGYGFLDRFKSDEAIAKYPLEYNPTKAQELLDGLGFQPGPDGIRVDDEGNKLSFVCVTPTQKGQPEYEIGALLADECAKVGIEITMKGYGNFWTMYDEWTLGRADMASIWMCGGTPDPIDFFSNFHTDVYVPIGEPATVGSWESSPCRVQDPRMDAVLDKMTSVDPLSDEAKPLYAEALEIFLEIMPGFPSIETLYTMAFNNAYWTNWPNEGNWYMVPFTWWDTFKMVLHGVKKV